MVDAFISSQFPHWRRTDDLSKLVTAINRRHTSICRQQFDAGSVALRPGIFEFIQTAARAGVRLAIATDEDASEVASVLHSNLGSRADKYIEVIAARLPTTTSRTTGAHLRALDALGLNPATCLAVESSQVGVRSAADAGIPTVMTSGLYPQLQECSDLLAADRRAAYASSMVVSRWDTGRPYQLLAELRMAHVAKSVANDTLLVSGDVQTASNPEIAYASG